MTPKTIAIIGAGERGAYFARLVERNNPPGKIVAVAEPRAQYRQALVECHAIPAGNVFASWQEFVARPRLCDAVVSTLDREHVGPAVACLQRGYDMLLEKPMGVTLAECRRIAAAQRKSKRIVGVCHSLRYQKGFRRVKELIAGGAIGQVMTLDLIEQVSFWHQAHSFVRGNWGNSRRSSPMLLAKSCHDLDYIAYLVDRPCRQVSSFGHRGYFRRANMPAGATPRCTDGCPHEPTCAYSAIRTYVNTSREHWPASVVSADHSREAHLRAIRTGPYGRCVWQCDNDVVDHQVVALEFAGHVTATFTMTGFTQGGGRRLRVHGTRGELHFDERSILIKMFAGQSERRIKLAAEHGGHGGGDPRVVTEWLAALRSRDDSRIVANAQESLKTHAIVFAAERSRVERRTVAL
jgi:predicted dehydrogenase